VTGKKLVNDNFFYLDDEYDFISANVDRRVVGENAGFEAKTMSSFNGYNIEAGEIPAHYFCQCQHYCMVRGWDYIYIGILVLQRGFYWHKIDRDEEFIKQLREAEIDFWTRYIEKDVMPEPDGSDASLDTVKELFPDAEPKTEIAIPGLDNLISDYKAYGELEKTYKEKKLAAQAQICKRLGDNEVGVGHNFGCSWKNQSKAYVNPKKLEQEYPAIYKKLVEVSEYRVFRTRHLEKKKGA
jgi:predicted phage-related endonuclease